MKHLENNTFNTFNDINKNRNIYIDWLKGFTILLVVLGHCPIDHSIFWVIYRFHMPLFFCISGYLFKDTQNFKIFLKKKIKTIIIPYTIFFFLSSAISFFLLKSNLNINKIIKYFIYNGRYCSLVSNYALWYLPHFFIASVIFYFMSKIKNKYIFSMVLIILLTLTVPFNSLLSKYFENNFIPFSIQVLPASLFFIGLGYAIKQWNIKDILKHKFIRKFTNKKIITTFCGLMFILGITLSAGLSDQILNITSYKYILTALLMIPLIIYCTKNNNNNILIYLGKNSLIILGIHRVLIALLVHNGWISFFTNIHINQNIAALLLALTVILIICVINEIISFFKSKITSLKFLKFQK